MDVHRVAGGAAAFIVNGKRMHYKTVVSQGWKNNEKWLREHVDPNAREVQSGDKHKYLYFLDRKLRKRLKELERPYPKS